MRYFLGANSAPPLCIVAFFPPHMARAGVLEPLKKWVWSRFEHYEFVDLLPCPFFQWLQYACANWRAQKNATTNNGGESFAPGKLGIGFHSHRECMEEAYEYANKLGKQGGENPRKIPKFFINHECFSRTIKKYLK